MGFSSSIKFEFKLKLNCVHCYRILTYVSGLSFCVCSIKYINIYVFVTWRLCTPCNQVKIIVA